MKIEFIGTGVMGTGMINNLLKANFEVTVYNRTKAHAQEVLNHGASWQQTPADVAKVSDVVITIVGSPRMSKKFILAITAFLRQQSLAKR